MEIQNLENCNARIAIISNARTAIISKAGNITHKNITAK